MPRKSRNPLTEKSPLVVAAVDNVQPAPVDNVKPNATTSVDDLVSSMEKLAVDPEPIDWEVERKLMDKVFEDQARDKLKKLPRFKMHKNLETKLKDYQQDGVRWLSQQERKTASDSPFVNERILKDGTVANYCSITRARLQEKPRPLCGAILADDMGLGKTVQTLGLILSNPPGAVKYPVTDKTKMPEDIGITTLIVCPKTVMVNWAAQIKEHLKEDTLRVELYDGPTRTTLIPKIQANDVDVLIVSYNTLASEYNRSAVSGNKEPQMKTSIFDCKFYRVVLDESHTIRDPSTATFRSCSAVPTIFRICLTGTPFVNRPDDIFSLLAFLGLDPLKSKELFDKHITTPIMEKRRVGLNRLRAVMSYVALRRTKALLDEDLVDKKVLVRCVDFLGGPHQEIYDKLSASSKACLEACLSNGDEDAKNFPHKMMFESVLRVRQACCHGELVPFERHERAGKVLEKLQSIPEPTYDEGINFLTYMQNGEPNVREETKGDGPTIGPSPKIYALLDAIAEMEGNEKAVIFSQWTSFLDLIQDELKSQGHKVARIDGSMSAQDRISNMEKFSMEDGGARFILCSLKAAGTGINLTRGNVVFLMDTWWNDATEMQAMDRVHRLGQTRDVKVIRFVMRGSVEERMVALQKSKAALGKGSMEKISEAEESLAKLTTLKDLLDLRHGEREEKDWD